MRGQGRVGIIGTGWGLMHVGAFRAAGAEIVALCGRDRAKTAEVARREGVPIATDDVGDLVRAADIVVVASPDALHRAHVTRALAAGRAVLCEKPLAATLDDAIALSSLATDANLAAMVFPYRALSPFLAARAWLGGRPAKIAVTVRSGFGWSAASGDRGGTSHVLDAVSWLLGRRAAHVHATGDDTASAFHIRYDDGALALVSWLLAPEPGIFGSWSIVTRDAELGFSASWVPAAGGWCIGPVRAYEAGAWRDLHPALVPAPGRLEPWAAACYAIARDFLAAHAGDPDARARLPTFEDGLAVQRLVALPPRDGPVSLSCSRMSQ